MRASYTVLLPGPPEELATASPLPLESRPAPSGGVSK